MSKVRTIEEIELAAASEPYFGKGITVAAGFDLGAKAPLDSRSICNTIAERDKHVTGNRVYPGMLVYVVENQVTYQYTGTAWKEFGFNSNDFQASVVDNLTSEDATKALSARQGKVLKGLIDAIDGRVITVEEAIKLLNGDATKVGSVAHSVAQALASANAYADGLVETAVEVLNAKDAELASSITNLQSTLEAKDTELNGKISANATAITGLQTEVAKKASQADLTAEINRATAAEGVLDGRLDVLEGDADTSGSVAHAVAGAIATAASDATTKANAALDSAKSYANALVDAINTDIESIQSDITDLQAADVQVLTDAKAYTDLREVEIKKVISSTETSLIGKIATAKSEAISAAATDASTKANAALASAKTYADTAVANLVDGAPEALDTLKEIADALNANDGVIEGVLAQIGLKADKATVDAGLAKKADKETVDAALALKASQADLTAEINRATAAEGVLGGRLDVVEASTEALETDVTAVSGRVDALESLASVVERYKKLAGNVALTLDHVPASGKEIKFFVNGVKYEVTVTGQTVNWVSATQGFALDADDVVEVYYFA